jgi:hypothetical protein
MKKILVILVLTACPFLLFAQKDLRQGYIITLNGDTVNGRLDFRGDINNSRNCIFYSGSNQIFKYLPFEIKSYRFKDGKYYISKSIEKQDTVKQIFAEYIVDGQRDLFYFKDNSGFHYLISNDNRTLVEIPFKSEIINEDGRLYQSETTTHIGYLKSYFRDCPSLFSEIEAIKKPNLHDLISLTKKYNQLTCRDSNCIVYYKKKMPFQFAVEPYIGTTRQQYFMNSYLTNYGAYLYAWLPESNEKLFFKTGLLFSEYAPENERIYKIPIQFEYLFPDKAIRPKFDIGVNAYTVKNSGITESIGLMMAVSGGILVHVSKHIFIDLTFETELFQFSYDTNFFISHSLGTGLFILL